MAVARPAEQPVSRRRQRINARAARTRSKHQCRAPLSWWDANNLLGHRLWTRTITCDKPAGHEGDHRRRVPRSGEGPLLVRWSEERLELERGMRALQGLPTREPAPPPEVRYLYETLSNRRPDLWVAPRIVRMAPSGLLSEQP